jgi:hypothetical protein
VFAPFANKVSNPVANARNRTLVNCRRRKGHAIARAPVGIMLDMDHSGKLNREWTRMDANDSVAGFMRGCGLSICE